MAKKSKNMNKILIGAGLLALAGGGYYVYAKPNISPEQAAFEKKYGKVKVMIVDNVAGQPQSLASSNTKEISLYRIMDIVADKDSEYKYVAKNDTFQGYMMITVLNRSNGKNQNLNIQVSPFDKVKIEAAQIEYNKINSTPIH